LIGKEAKYIFQNMILVPVIDAVFSLKENGYSVVFEISNRMASLMRIHLSRKLIRVSYVRDLTQAILKIYYIQHSLNPEMDKQEQFHLVGQNG